MYMPSEALLFIVVAERLKGTSYMFDVIVSVSGYKTMQTL